MEADSKHSSFRKSDGLGERFPIAWSLSMGCSQFRAELQKTWRLVCRSSDRRVEFSATMFRAAARAKLLMLLDLAPQPNSANDGRSAAGNTRTRNDTLGFRFYGSIGIPAVNSVQAIQLLTFRVQWSCRPTAVGSCRLHHLPRRLCHWRSH